MIGMRREAGIVHRGDRGGAFQEPGQRQRVGGLCLHPKGLSVWRPCYIRSAPPITAPATRSEWPPRYLVALWKTRSKPAWSGRKFTGDANVLSMTVTTPSRRPKSA